jgi:hypothetical protein
MWATPIHKTHHVSWNWGGIIILFPIIYFLDGGEGNIVMAKIGMKFPSGSPKITKLWVLIFCKLLYHLHMNFKLKDLKIIVVILEEKFTIMYQVL